MSELYKEGTDWLVFTTVDDLVDSIAINRTAGDLEIINVLSLSIDHSGFGDTNPIIESANLHDVVLAIKEAIGKNLISEDSIKQYLSTLRVNEM